MEAVPSPNAAMTLAGLGIEQFLNLDNQVSPGSASTTSPLTSFTSPLTSFTSPSTSFTSSTSPSGYITKEETSPASASSAQSSLPAFFPSGAQVNPWHAISRPAPPPPPAPSASVGLCGIVCDVHYRIMQLELNAQFANTARQLRHMFITSAAELEKQRRQQLRSILDSWQAVEIERFFEGQVRLLIERIWPCLHPYTAGVDVPSPMELPTSVPSPTSAPIPSPLLPPLAPPTSTERPSTGIMTPDAVSILLRWYEQHQDHPYPSNDTAVLLAQTAKLSVRQVKKWFANRRRRNQHMKPMAEVVQKRYSPYHVKSSVKCPQL